MIVALVSLIVILSLVVFVAGIHASKAAASYVTNEKIRIDQEVNAVGEHFASERESLRQERESLLKHHVEALAGMTSFGRYQLDVGAQALKYQGIIDARVAARTTVVTVDEKTGQVIATPRKRAQDIGEQPPDPSVRMTSIIDEIHEAERDAARILSDDVPWTSRDERRELIEP